MITYTFEQLKEVLNNLNIYLYRNESGYQLNNAQRNLQGRTHYVNDDTLRVFKSRILRSGHTTNGLFFIIQESLPIGSFNGVRQRRTVVFDVFGRVFENDLNEITRDITHKNAGAADKHYYHIFDYMNKYELDHASDLITRYVKRENDKIQSALNIIKLEG